VCDLETSRMRRSWPALGRSATGGKKRLYRKCVRGRTGDVTWHHVSCGLKTERLPPCLFQRLGFFLLLNIISRCQTFLWGYLKKKVCIWHNPHSLDKLKQNILDRILNATTGTLHKVAINMSNGVDVYISEHRGHCQHLLSDC